MLSRNLPKEIQEAIELEADQLSKKCKPCDIIKNRQVITKNIMDDYYVTVYSIERFKSITEYCYYKGMLEALKAESAKSKEHLSIKAKEVVVKYESNLARDGIRFRGEK